MKKFNNFIRTQVSGKRNRLNQDGYNLDITPITPRMLAMSFPASKGMQKLYRNDIMDVAKYLKDKHGNNYFIYNMSGKEYDCSPFDGQVLTA